MQRFEGDRDFAMPPAELFASTLIDFSTSTDLTALAARRAPPTAACLVPRAVPRALAAVACA